MKILLIGGELNTPRLLAAAKSEGCETEILTSRAFASLPEDAELKADVALLGRDHGDREAYVHTEGLRAVPLRAALSAGDAAAGLSSLSPGENALCCRYCFYGGEENLRNLIRFFKNKIYGGALPAEPRPLPLDSIYTFDGRFFDSPARYISEYEKGYSVYVGMLGYRSHWESGDTAPDRLLKNELNKRGIGVICAFSAGTPGGEAGGLTMEEAVNRFFCAGGRPVISLLINFLVFGVSEGEGESLFERAAEVYAGLDMPVVRPVQSNYLSNSRWEQSDAPFASDAALHFDVPELQGMTETLFLGGCDGRRTHTPVPERAARIADRISAWLELRQKPNSQKKLAVMMNSAVCSGVEATLGRAAALNAFDSAAKLLKNLRAAGWDTGDIPENGEELRSMLLNRKAYSDFRWTPAEDIAAAGGVLYRMSAAEYKELLRRRGEKLRLTVEAMWGEAPGEAMVLDGELLITGLRFGNVLLMIQPKRGCYGSKCTGEVCKILQDPKCPPTHQYLATYWYLQDVLGAAAVLHFGTHGSLEFLPGKASGLSADCFPDAALGRLPNIYLYSAASTAPALLAKRRSYAVTVDHLAERDRLHSLTDAETGALMHALDGGFVLPGMGGEAADGPIETGRNLYGVRPDKIPTQSAYDRGAEAAEALVKSYLADEGRYPEQIALNMISLDIPRTGGEQMSQMLRLLGVRPVWDARGTVNGIECMPLTELGRPRMDVSVQISGILRDTWPNVLRLLDDAVTLAAAQDETPEENFLIGNIGVRADGESIARIFGGAPGTYANSIGLALKASAWQSEDELARYFIDSSSYVYGKDKYGEKNIAAFLDGIKRTDATCGITSMRHTDAINSSYSSRVQGGYALAAKSMGLDKKVRGYTGESSGTGVRVVTLAQHVSEGLKNTLLDDNWLRERREQGYDGAAEIMCRIQNVFDMQAVNESFDSAELDELAKKCVLDDEMRLWMQENNKFAAEESGRRFLELNERGKWKPAPEVLQQLRTGYLKAEAELEDGVSGLGEIQAGSIDIITDKTVGEWNERLRSSDAEIERWKKQNC